MIGDDLNEITADHLSLASGPEAEKMMTILGYSHRDNVQSIQINFTAGEVVTVTVERLMTRAEANALNILTKRLVEKQ